MNDPRIPSYPVVHVTVHPDGSAHVNVAGDHRNYPAGDIQDTRAQVTAYAIAVAERLGRGVRLTVIDPDGHWKLGVYPDAEVVDLEPASPKSRREPTAASRPRLLGGPVPGHPGLCLPSPAVAVLALSTGEKVRIGVPAVIGRRPHEATDVRSGCQLVAVADPSKTLSRVHAEVRWNGLALTITDLASGNGTRILRPRDTFETLGAGERHELADGDVLILGAAVRLTVMIPEWTTTA
jgi:hypothetical protein